MEGLGKFYGRVAKGRNERFAMECSVRKVPPLSPSLIHASTSRLRHPWHTFIFLTSVTLVPSEPLPHHNPVGRGEGEVGLELEVDEELEVDQGDV
jgi:hypothetical protein